MQLLKSASQIGNWENGDLADWKWGFLAEMQIASWVSCFFWRVYLGGDFAATPGGYDVFRKEGKKCWLPKNRGDLGGVYPRGGCKAVFS